MIELKVDSENKAASNLNESLFKLTVKKFLLCKVKVETLDGLNLEGLLVKILRSRHNGIGSLILKNESGVHLVKCWAVIARYNCKLERKGGENAKWKSFGGKQLEKCAR